MSFTSLSTLLLFRLFSQPQGYSQELYNLTTIIPYKRGKKVEEEEERHRPAVFLKIPSSIVPRHVPLALNSQRVLVCCSVYGQCNRKTSVKFFFFAESHTFQMCFFFWCNTQREIVFRPRPNPIRFRFLPSKVVQRSTTRPTSHPRSCCCSAS